MLHRPVLLHEAIAYLDPKPGNFIIDGTVDGGGHATEAVKRILPDGMFLGIDLDQRLVADTEKRMRETFNEKAPQAIRNMMFRCGNYADLPAILAELQLPMADGLLLDLGFSSEQLESSGRGFSFLRNEPLLMTYDEEREPLRSRLRKLGEDELARIIRELGGERMAHRVARAIKERAKAGAMETSEDLARAVRGALPKSYERGRIDPATRTFQALRMYANDERENLTRMLAALTQTVKTGGRAVIISFHSEEDRLVKQAFRDGERRGEYSILTKKPVTPSPAEIAENPRSRSAKLRAIEIL